jgi:hypothetical protein
MNKISQTMIYNIFINSPKFKIQNVEPIESEIPGSIKILLHSPTMELVIVIDERFNTIHIPKKILSKEESKAIEYIRLKFNELKISDPSYGNIDSGKIEYEPSKYIFTKEFFKFLQKENRESILESILN